MLSSRTRSLLPAAGLALSVLAVACAPGAPGVCVADPTAAGCSDSSGATVPGHSTSASADAGASVGPTSAGSSPADAGSSTASNGSGNGSTQPDAGTTTGSTGSGSTGSTGGTATTQTSGTADATQLPAATTAQIPLTAEYDALNVPALAAGATYKDPTTGVKIYKISSSSFPASSPTWNHDYSEGGDEISLPYNGDDKTRAVLMRDATSAFWLVDFTPGAGVGNARKLTGSGKPSPFMDLAFAFSSNPATPYYAYVSDAAAIRRIDIRTGAEAPGNNWPQTGETYGTWLNQSANDGLFVWMRGSTGGVVVMFEPSTGTKKVYTNEGINEPRIDRGGRYVAMNMNAGNAMQVYDFQAGAISWSMGGDPGIPFAHGASLQHRWMGVDWNETYPGQYTVIHPEVANSQYRLDGPANGTLVHGSGNWLQNPEDPDDQYALFDSYNYLRPQPTTVSWLAPGGMVFVNANGGRALLGHAYNNTTNYMLQAFAKTSSDGKYVLFASNMDGSSRTDLFLAEMPTK